MGIPLCEQCGQMVDDFGYHVHPENDYRCRLITIKNASVNELKRWASKPKSYPELGLLAQQELSNRKEDKSSRRNPRRKNPVDRAERRELVAIRKGIMDNSPLGLENLFISKSKGTGYGLTISHPKVMGAFEIYQSFDSEHNVNDWFQAYKIQVKGGPSFSHEGWLTSSYSYAPKLTDFYDFGVDIGNLLTDALENTTPSRRNPNSSSLGAIALAGLTGFLIGKK